MKEFTTKGNTLVLEERNWIPLLHMEDADMDSVRSSVCTLCLRKSEK